MWVEVAIATVRNVPSVPVVAVQGTRFEWFSVVEVQGRQFHHAADVVHVRRLTVLDLAKPVASAQLLATVAAVDGLTPEQVAGVQELADALAADAAPEKPDEPLGLGAVIETEVGGAGGQWIRVTGPNAQRPWMNRSTGEKRAFVDVPAVRVLGEGVSS